MYRRIQCRFESTQVAWVVGWRHPDDGVGLPTHTKFLSDRVQVAAKRALPKPMAQYDDPVGVGRDVVLGTEQMARVWAETQEREVVAGDRLAHQYLELAGPFDL